MSLEARWHELWSSVASSDSGQEFSAIVAAYNENHRAYHNENHLRDCLADLDTVAHVATAPTDVELALWFHDVVYKPLSARNERASASWATRSLERGGAPAATVDRVVSFIMATEHKEAPEDPDARLVVDIDLAVLGRDRDGYQLYEDGVRKEFSWVPGATFRNRRATVLSKFLKRPSIYCTKTFQERYEKQARKNLESAIAKLRRGG